MLRNVIILNGAGLLVFEKVWVGTGTKNEDKGRLFGSLIRTMQEFSKQSTGMLVTFIEYPEVALSIVDDVKTRLICILFHDLEDGSEFGRTIATEILRSFIETYSESSFTGTLNTSLFNGFTSKIFDAIQHSVKTIVAKLQSNRGVTSVVVLYEDGTAVMPALEEDQLGIIANIQPMITFSNDIMSAKKERAKAISIGMNKYLVVIHKVGDAHLIVVCRKSIKPSIYTKEIAHAVVMLDKVFALSRSLSFASGKY